jgi:hypothetical protein
MRKLAHVPIQTWRGWDPNDLFGGWFSALGGFKTLNPPNIHLTVCPDGFVSLDDRLHQINQSLRLFCAGGG